MGMVFRGKTWGKKLGLNEIPEVALREEGELPCLLSGDGGGVIPFPMLGASRKLLPDAIF